MKIFFARRVCGFAVIVCGLLASTQYGLLAGVLMTNLMATPLVLVWRGLALGADISITAASVAPSANAVLDTSRKAGATITAGQSVYLDTATNTWKLLDTDAAAPANGVSTTVGVAVNGASSGQPITVCTQDPALTVGGTVNAGDTVWASANAGGMTKTFADIVTGMFTTIMGTGIGSNQINLKPLQSGVAHA